MILQAGLVLSSSYAQAGVRGRAGCRRGPAHQTRHRPDCLL